MMKWISVVMAFAVALSLASVAAAADQKAVPKKALKTHQLTGTVEAVDAAAGTLTVRGKQDSVSLKASGKVTLDKIVVGDKVLVRYSGHTASSVKKIPAAKKMAKKEMKKAAHAAPAAPAEKK